MILFLDSETTGTSRAKSIHPLGQPRAIQLAWIVTDNDGNALAEKSYLVKPEGWEIDPRSEWHKEHNYTTDKLKADGFPIRDVLADLIQDAFGCWLWVSHNLTFDQAVLSGELFRANLRMKALDSFCTMQETRGYVDAKDKNGRRKAPRLQDLHLKLFGIEYDGAHDALADVRAMADCFFALIENKLIALNPPQ